MKHTLMLTGLLCILIMTGMASARDRDLERIRIEGRIESIRGQTAYVRDDCGTRFSVHLGPAWYWEDCGYRLRSNCDVTIIAWQDRDDDYCYAGEIRGRDFCYDLCDSRGYPRWSDREQCHDTWRPTRAFFDINFVIGGPVWHCNPPRHHDHDNHHGHHGDWNRGHDRDRDRDHCGNKPERRTWRRR